MMYERLQTRNIDDLGGVATTMPYLAAFFVVFSMANIGVPGTSGFIGELMVLVSFLKHQPWISAIAALSLIISASYTLWMVRRVFYGPVNPKMTLAEDVSAQERSVLTIFVVCIFFFGLYPKPLSDLLLTSSEAVVTSASHVKIGAKS
jgi:NADH-quinone oxidoreductase subunit M